MSEANGQQAHPIVRYSRTVTLSWAVALGASVTVGLGVFVLLGSLGPLAGRQLAPAYLLAVALFTPVALTYAERAVVTPGSGGPYSLARAGEANRRAYFAGWLLLGAYVVLAALLGWGAALHLNLSLARFLDLPIVSSWLAPALVILVALNELLGTRSRGGCARFSSTARCWRCCW